jgi:hypothetical protein
MVCTSSVVGSIDRSDLRRRSFSSGLMVLACSVVALLTGCGIGNVDHSLSSEPIQGAVLQGRVHGGNQPVSGSTIQLYEIEPTAGETGYPGDAGATAPKPLLSGITTDSAGNFAITQKYTCDNLTDDVYITATQGNPGLGDGGSNPNLALMAALGPCNGLKPTTFININEVTTIASVYALAQFAGVNTSDGGITISSSGGNASTGLANAFATVNNLVDTSTGQVLTETPAYTQSGDVPYFNSSTVPQARINTLGNILANCVNSNGSSDTGAACNLLFAAATPNGGTAPADTLQAALDIAQNPGNNVGALYALSTANAPFQPALGLAAPGPNDWTIALTFTGAGLGFAPGSGYQLANTSLDIDDLGNIWTTAWDSVNTTTAATTSMIAEFNYLGAPMTKVSSEVIPPSGTPVVAYGGYQPYNATTNQGEGVVGPFSAVIDPSENVWVGNTAGLISVVSPNLSLAFADPTGIGNIGPSGTVLPYIAFDGSGDAWVAGGKAIGEYDSSGDIQSPSTGWTGGSAPYTSNWYGNVGVPTFDSAGNLWATDVNFGDFYRISTVPDATLGQLVDDYYQNGNGPGNTPLAADGSGNIYACDVAHDGFTVYNANSTSPGASFAGASAARCAQYLAIDGLNHLWAVSGGAIDEYTASGTILSPAPTGFTGTSNGELAVGGGVGVAIDGSGNLWTLNSNTGSSLIPGNALVEFIGLAGPVITPHSLALQEVELATRP